ncbi:MAG: DUF2795 domain-containing protein [Thermoleophilia bacterium]
MQADEIARYLEHLQLPASKNEVVHAAKKAGAPKEIWKALDKQLPWLTFQHLDDILQPLGLSKEDAA